MFLLILFENHSPPAWGVPSAGGNPERVRAAGDSSSHTEPPKPTFNYRATGGSGSTTGRQSQCSTTGPLGQRFSYRPTEPMFNYRATGGSGSHTGRQSQRSTTGPPEAAVLIQADRANVQLQGRWGQRFSYGADRAKVQLQGFRTGRLCFSRALSEHTALFSALPYARGDVSVINSIFLAGGVDGTQGIEYTLCMKER